ADWNDYRPGHSRSRWHGRDPDDRWQSQSPPAYDRQSCDCASNGYHSLDPTEMGCELASSLAPRSGHLRRHFWFAVRMGWFAPIERPSGFQSKNRNLMLNTASLADAQPTCSPGTKA